ncbi:type II secretion system protein, partial [Patescibacteria group bacterium]|nr:type II secretion system protein [Patescibacteria group bacterium]
MRKNSRKKGFTLVELMAVIGVIGVLMAVVLVGASSSRKTANISTTAQQIQLIYSACQSWLGNGRVNYTGITLAKLQSAGYLPTTLNSPYGGAYTVAPNT